MKGDVARTDGNTTLAFHPSLTYNGGRVAKQTKLLERDIFGRSSVWLFEMWEVTLVSECFYYHVNPQYRAKIIRRREREQTVYHVSPCDVTTTKQGRKLMGMEQGQK